APRRGRSTPPMKSRSRRSWRARSRSARCRRSCGAGWSSTRPSASSRWSSSWASMPGRAARRASWECAHEREGARVIAGLKVPPPPDPARLLHWVDRLREHRALVWGDFVLDEYWRCRSSRVSREAPVLVLDWEQREVQPGGAANAALNLAAMGARVAAAGFVGDDAAGEELRRALRDRGVDTAALMALPGAHTVVKVRVTAGSAHTARQQVVRIDRGTAFAPPRASITRFARDLERAAEGGRAVVAAAVLARAAGGPPLLVAAVANVAGRVAVSRRGAVAVGTGDLRRAIGRARGGEGSGSSAQPARRPATMRHAATRHVARAARGGARSAGRGR